jgi:hypothetical protein
MNVPHRLRPALGAALIAAVGIAMAAWTWGTWLDPLIDFGRELYVPWQINEGRVLYRDLAYFNGPLSPYWNAALFAVFGVGLDTLVSANLAILAIATALLFGWLRMIAGTLAATAGGILFLTHCAFGQKIWVANFNWICPYSHEMTHGFVLTLGALAAAGRWSQHRGRLALAAAGVCLGLCALTKPEILLAAALATAASLGAVWLCDANARRTALRDVALLAGSALAPALAAFALLASALPAGDALRGTIGGWLHVGNPELTGLRYYQWCLGTDDLGASLAKIAGWSGAWLAVFGLPALALLAGRRALRGPMAWLAVVPSLGVVAWAAARIAAIVPLEYGDDSTGLQNAYRPLTVLAVAAVAIAGMRVGRRRGEPRAAHATLVFAVLAAVMLAKMFFHARTHHYGFTLAVPALLLAVALLVGWLPAALRARGAAGAPMLVLGLAALAVSVFFQLRTDDYWLARKTYPVGAGRDAFLGEREGRGEIVQLVLNELRQKAAPGAQMLVLPEGVTLNYLTRRPSPSMHFNFMPPEFAMFGEDAMLQDIQRRPPEWVVVAERRTTEYGFDHFGRHYGVRLMDWIRANYTSAALVGQLPLIPERLVDRYFGILLLKYAPR